MKITEGHLRVTEADVIAFSQSLRDNKTPAWQRLQAVRAIEAYRDLVLTSDQPSLQMIRQTLSRIADQEKANEPGTDRPGIEDEPHLIGWIDPAEPAVSRFRRRRPPNLQPVAVRRRRRLRLGVKRSTARSGRESFSGKPFLV